jgi:hypothetical protein
MWQRNVWCVCVCACVLCGGVCWTACSPAYVSTQNATQTHQTLRCRITKNNLHNFKKIINMFKFSDFNKEPSSSLKMI